MVDFFLIFLILCATYIFIQLKKPKNYPPGPIFIPLVGNFHHVKNLSQKLGGRQFAFEEMTKKFNSETIGLKFGDELIVVLHAFDKIKQILSDDDYLARPNNFFMELRTLKMKEDLIQFICQKFRSILNTDEGKNTNWKLGITGNDGEAWKANRNFVLFHLKQNSQSSERNITNLIHEESQNLITKLASFNSENIEMKSLFSPIVMNLFWTFTTGSKLENNPRMKKMIQLLDKRNQTFDIAGGFLTVFPTLRFVFPKASGYELICDLNQELGELLAEVVDEHYKTWTEDRNDDLIYAYITELKKNRTYFTDDHLKVILLDILIAASQTTSSTLSFMIMMMIVRPDIQEKIHTLLSENFNKNERIRYKDRHKVPYIEAFIMETQRYFCITPIIGPRRALQFKQIDDFEIPRDTTILLNIHSVFHDEKYWGTPSEFRPERFLNDAENCINNHEYFLPFGLGKRRCLGDIAARNCLFVFFVETVRNFVVKPTADRGSYPKMIPQQGIVLSPQPYQVKFVERE